MVLTSQAHQCRTPKKNRRIPTIPTGRFDAGIVHVSAVDTGPRRSESGGAVHLDDAGSHPSNSETPGHLGHRTPCLRFHPEGRAKTHVAASHSAQLTISMA